MAPKDTQVVKLRTTAKVRKKGKWSAEYILTRQTPNYRCRNVWNALNTGPLVLNDMILVHDLVTIYKVAETLSSFLRGLDHKQSEPLAETKVINRVREKR